MHYDNGRRLRPLGRVGASARPWSRSHARPPRTEIAQPWRLVAGAIAPADAVALVERTRAITELRELLSLALYELAHFAHATPEIADAARTAATTIGDVALPLVALKDGGEA